ncbi:amidohydrolase family protein [Lutibaculum baratangense]|uniref:Amidohydrolase 2 n=1 Tax=Lutibaculum baratangense AMV1 TaxID=631454 RepID=V4THT4_9HYPH|nr:amidohydrolase family protein [Lutibaculum baratangense]ESR25588.1 amidohydrolase 2 [Lutibaculum baratangense AMV1]
MHRIVDIHPHVISPDTERYRPAPLGGKQSSWSQKHPLTHEDLVAEMDRAGVEKAVVVQASTVYGHDNSYVADAVAAHPDRLTGVFSVDVLADDAVEKIEHWRSRGLTGLRLFTAGSTMEGQADWLNDPRSHAAWDHATRTRLPICVQMRPPGIPLLRDLMERFPNAIVVIDHLARAVLDDGPRFEASAPLWDLARFPGVHLKLTVRNIDAAGQGTSTVPDLMDHLMKTYGADRVAWGSNFPAAERPLPELVARAREAVSTLPEADQAAILSGTALKLYPALATSPAGAEA